MKVAVIGGGSTYTPELVNGFLERTKNFPLKELWLEEWAVVPRGQAAEGNRR